MLKIFAESLPTTDATWPNFPKEISSKVPEKPDNDNSDNCPNTESDLRLVSSAKLSRETDPPSTCYVNPWVICTDTDLIRHHERKHDPTSTKETHQKQDDVRMDMYLFRYLKR